MKKSHYAITCENRNTEKWEYFKFTDFEKLVSSIDLTKYEVVAIWPKNFASKDKDMALNNIRAYFKHLEALYEQNYFDYVNSEERED
jgi:hypothetical protein